MVWHVNQIDAGHRLEQLARNMDRGSDAAGCHVDLSRICFRVSNELGDSVGWNRRIDHHDVGYPHDAGNRCNVADEIETKMIVERGVDRVCRGNQQQRVAIRGSPHNRFGRNVGAGAWPVLDNELLVKPLR